MTSLWKIFAALLTLMGLVFILSFVNHAQEELICSDFQIEVNNNFNHYFIDEQGIAQTLINQNLSPIGLKTSEIQLNKIEESIEKIAEVQNAEVFLTVDGKVSTKVQQRNPIVRVFNQNGTGFYIDDLGKQMNLSRNYTARVLVFSGYINEPINNLDYAEIVTNEEMRKERIYDEIFELTKLLTTDTLFQYNIEQVFVTKQSETVLIPKIGDHKIVLGSVEDMKEKLEKLKVFYKKGLNNTDWNRYDTINLKFKNQVVCKLKN